MIEDATKTSNQTSLRPARLEDLSRLGEGWEYETAGGKRWRFDRRTMGGQVCFSEEGQTQRLRKLELPWAIEHGLLYCPVEEPKPLECEGTLLKVGSNVTMYMGEAWAGKRVKVMEVREGEDIVRLPKGSTVLGPEASDAVARFRQANGIWEAHKATYSLDQVDPEDWMSVDHELHEDAGRAFFALSAFLCPTQE